MSGSRRSLFFMFFFNLLRGLATTGWLPWVSALVPPSLRGRYFSTDKLADNLSGAVAFFFCGLIFGSQPTNYNFGLVYVVALLCGWTSLVFLKRIECPPPKPGKPKLEPFKIWVGRVWRDKPFRRLIRLNIVFYVMIGAWDPFTTLFMRDSLNVPEHIILYISGVKMLGAVASAWGWGILSDRFSSRPILTLAIWTSLVAMAGWFLLSLGLLPPSTLLLMLFLSCLSGRFHRLYRRRPALHHEQRAQGLPGPGPVAFFRPPKPEQWALAQLVGIFPGCDQGSAPALARPGHRPLYPVLWRNDRTDGDHFRAGPPPARPIRHYTARRSLSHDHRLSTSRHPIGLSPAFPNQRP